jgi:hypothetical protein
LTLRFFFGGECLRRGRIERHECVCKKRMTYTWAKKSRERDATQRNKAKKGEALTSSEITAAQLIGRETFYRLARSAAPGAHGHFYFVEPERFRCQ